MRPGKVWRAFWNGSWAARNRLLGERRLAPLLEMHTFQTAMSSSCTANPMSPLQAPPHELAVRIKRSKAGVIGASQLLQRRQLRAPAIQHLAPNLRCMGHGRAIAWGKACMG